MALAYGNEVFLPIGFTVKVEHSPLLVSYSTDGFAIITEDNLMVGSNSSGRVDYSIPIESTNVVSMVSHSSGVFVLHRDMSVLLFNYNLSESRVINGTFISMCKLADDSVSLLSEDGRILNAHADDIYSLPHDIEIEDEHRNISPFDMPEPMRMNHGGDAYVLWNEYRVVETGRGASRDIAVDRIPPIVQCTRNINTTFILCVDGSVWMVDGNGDLQPIRGSDFGAICQITYYGDNTMIIEEDYWVVGVKSQDSDVELLDGEPRRLPQYADLTSNDINMNRGRRVKRAI